MSSYLWLHDTFPFLLIISPFVLLHTYTHTSPNSPFTNFRRLIVVMSERLDWDPTVVNIALQSIMDDAANLVRALCPPDKIEFVMQLYDLMHAVRNKFRGHGVLRDAWKAVLVSLHDYLPPNIIPVLQVAGNLSTRSYWDFLAVVGSELFDIIEGVDPDIPGLCTKICKMFLSDYLKKGIVENVGNLITSLSMGDDIDVVIEHAASILEATGNKRFNVIGRKAFRSLAALMKGISGTDVSSIFSSATSNLTASARKLPDNVAAYRSEIREGLNTTYVAVFGDNYTREFSGFRDLILCLAGGPNLIDSESTCKLISRVTRVAFTSTGLRCVSEVRCLLRLLLVFFITSLHFSDYFVTILSSLYNLLTLSHSFHLSLALSICIALFLTLSLSLLFSVYLNRRK